MIVGGECGFCFVFVFGGEGFYFSLLFWRGSEELEVKELFKKSTRRRRI